MESEPPRSAEDALAEFLFRREQGEELDFESFCAAFDGDREELRELHRDWSSLAAGLDEGRPDSQGRDAFGALRDALVDREEPFERYDLCEEIAHGGMGAVVRVWDRDLERHLAMKVTKSGGVPGTPRSPDAESRSLGRFLEEAKVTGQLDHPGIVPVHELGVDREGRCYFTMKLVRGRNFKAIIECVRQGTEGWTMHRALQVILKVCEALAYAHSKDVIHRDIKPANVMVGRFGEVYLMDWGLARVQGHPDARDIRPRCFDADRSDEIHSVRHAEDETGDAVITMDGHVVGTPAYIPPEQAAGEVDKVGRRSDVYSVGATLYHLLAGAMPYVPRGAYRSANTVLAMVLQGPPRPVSEVARDVPLELAAICEKAMAREREDRYAGAAELAEDLQAFLEGRTISVYRGGAAWELRKWVSRNRALAVASFAAVILALTTSTAWAFYLAARNERLATDQEEALTGEAIAVAEREQLDVESTELIRNLRAADEALLAELRQRAGELSPPFPEHLESHREWLRSAWTLHDRAPLHASLLERLRESGAEAWERNPQARLVGELAEFAREPHGPLPRVEARAALAEEIGERSVEGLDAGARWARTVEEIAAAPAYGGLVIAPQLGLVPLGADPDSGLFEFAALATGAPPRRDDAGRLIQGEESGVVLVLVPGGRFAMGAQSSDPAAPGYDEGAEASEAPVREVTVEPFFLARHELSRAQWLRATGVGAGGDGLLPVSGIGWFEGKRVLAGLDLCLPGEVQWEYAARGGALAPWWWGADAEGSSGRAELSTGVGEEGGPVSIHALEPNTFGLHHVLGNVAEWCDDPPIDYDSPFVDPARRELRIIRGGSFRDLPENARLADRYAGSAAEGLPTVGLRAARPLRR